MDMGTIILIVCFLIVGATYDWIFRQPRFGTTYIHLGQNKK